MLSIERSITFTSSETNKPRRSQPDQQNGQRKMTQEKTSTIVAFHIGRGGRFHNAGFKSFIGAKKITDFTDNLFLGYENEMECLKHTKEKFGEYFWGNGQIDGRKDLESYFLDLLTDEKIDDLENIFGVTAQDLGEYGYKTSGGSFMLAYANDGTGLIDIDGGYDTTYCCYLEDCDDEEIRLIADSNEWNKIALLEEFGYENVEIFEGLDMLTEMIDAGDYGQSLEYSGISEISKEDHEDNDYNKVTYFQGKYYTND